MDSIVIILGAATFFAFAWNYIQQVEIQSLQKSEELIFQRLKDIEDELGDTK